MLDGGKLEIGRRFRMSGAREKEFHIACVSEGEIPLDNMPVHLHNEFVSGKGFGSSFDRAVFECLFFDDDACEIKNVSHFIGCDAWSFEFQSVSENVGYAGCGFAFLRCSGIARNNLISITRSKRNAC